MKAFLMYQDSDVDLEAPLPANEQDLRADLELDTLLRAMASGDTFLFEVARRSVLTPLQHPEEIAYRQAVLRDFVDQPDVIAQMYRIAVDSIEQERKVWGSLFRSPNSILYRSVQVLGVFVDGLKQLRRIADEHAGLFRSDGVTRLFGMLEKELDDDYFDTVESHLRELKFRQGTLMSARLGRGNRGTGYVLRRPNPKPRFTERLTTRSQPAYSFQISDRDEAGARALGELKDRGVNLVANAAAQSAEHVLGFFTMLRAELGFYIGCLNLRARLYEKGYQTCFPDAPASGTADLSFDGLYDACLALTTSDHVVANTLNANHKRLVMITGANQGGKSTFLRSIGLAQLMTQCGMFAPATSYRATVCDALFTHYQREEDTTMESGKLDEELSRMSTIAAHITGRSILLCNESFSSTNEQEGSQIARQIIRAVLEAGGRIFYVTHSFDLAGGLYQRGTDTALFLRAERKPDGQRTFQLTQGEPLSTSYGQDLYKQVFESTVAR